MIDRLEDVYRVARHAFDLIVDRAVALNWWWVAAGVLLYELSQVVRARGWFNIIRAAYPGADELRARDVTGAYLAGVGLNNLLPARGGDFLKLFMVHRRLRSSRYSTLVATFVPETLFETVVGIALVVWALLHGFLPVPVAPGELPTLDLSFVIVHPVLSSLAAAGLAIALVLLTGRLRGRLRGTTARLRQGLSILHRPRDFVVGVVSWQALSRLIRLGGLACFMAALHLPLTVDTAVLVMAAQGAGRIIPLAPVSAGLRVAMLSYGFVEVTDKPVDVASITSFWFAVGAAQVVVGALIGAAIVCATFGTLSPRRALGTVRAAANEAGPVAKPAAP